MRRAAKADRNQSEIVAALRAVGASVQPLHAVGQGCPDLLVGFRGQCFAIEVKDGLLPPSDRKLTPAQIKWHRDWRGHVAVVLTAEDALRVIGVESYRDLHGRIVGNEASRKGCNPSGSDHNPNSHERVRL
ncbi:hypothetical protein NM680_10580 [Paracoccus sp. PS-1]|uniref:hypothetical protein n=1 Tax=Paracoccus sp. PS1 TaxID=2963938 RepID=UPI0027E3CF21|nr:hypothetical protein [Paracoccus sp. PS1]MDQ7262239.1 hypothetical protein [Paracoccus sp. PS1]